MNSELTPGQSAGTTDNPQSATGGVGASDSNSFQRSAGPETLSQNHAISVDQTGKPLATGSAGNGSAALMWVFVVVASILLVLIASSVFKWVMKRPESKEPIENPKEKAAKPLKEKQATKSVPEPAIKEEAIKKPTIEVIRPRGKKKQSRSKRAKK